MSPEELTETYQAYGIPREAWYSRANTVLALLRIAVFEQPLGIGED